MDDVLCDFMGAYIRQKKIEPEIKYPQSVPNFFENLEPLPGAIEAVNKLRQDSRFDVYVLSAPSTRNPLSYTEKRIWIEKHFDYNFAERLILSSNKALLKGDLLIDDYESGKGQENFEGNLIVFGSKSYPDWDSVLKYLI